MRSSAAPPRSSSRSPAPRRCGRGAVGAADLDHAPVVVELRSTGREVDSDRGTVRSGRGQRRRNRRRDVDHDHVAGLEQLGQLGERVVADRPLPAPGDQKPHLVAGEAASLGRLVGLERGLQLERERGHAGTAEAGRRQLARPVATARKIALDQPEQAGHAVLGRRAVGDVLARERVLVHLRPHVAGVDRVDPQRRVLLGKDRRGLVERGLRGPVAAPAGVRLDGGVGADIDDHAAVGHARQDELGEPDRGQDIDPVDALEHVERVRPSDGWGLGPSIEALLTSRSTCSPAASTSAPRCQSSATSPASATTSVSCPSSRAARSSSEAPRASITSAQWRSASERARARPRPRELPVMIASGMAATVGRWRSRLPGAIGPKTQVRRVRSAPRARRPASGR